MVSTLLRYATKKQNIKRKVSIELEVIGNRQQSDILTSICMTHIIVENNMKIVSFNRRKPTVTEVDHNGKGRLSVKGRNVLDYQYINSILELK